MQIIVKAPKNEGGFPPIEAGSYRAICYGLIVEGTFFNPVYEKTSKKVRIMWELPDERITVDGEDKPRAISAEYNLSLHEKSALYSMLIGWRGRDFTPEELEGFDLVNIVKAPCLISTTIGTNPKTGKEYANVSAVGRLPKGMIVPKDTENPVVIFDITNRDCPLEDMEKLPEWIQNRIKDSVEYKERTDPSVDEYAVVSNDEDLPFDV